jgi:hypothetical protein
MPQFIEISFFSRSLYHPISPSIFLRAVGGVDFDIVQREIGGEKGEKGLSLMEVHSHFKGLLFDDLCGFLF